MSKTLVKKVKLEKGGYLYDADKNTPVSHSGFVAAQKRAEYICTFAELAKDKDFKGKEAFTIDKLQKLVAEKLADTAIEHVKAPSKPARELTDKLAEEAKAFMAFEDGKANAEKVNAFLQEFNVIYDFENNGLFFEEGIVRLNKLYTMSDIVSAVEECIDLLD